MFCRPSFPSVVVPAAALLLAGFAIPGSAQKTDVVQLANGSTVIGEVKEMRQGIIRYSTTGMSTVSVEWARVTFVESRHVFEVETTGGRLLYGSLGIGDAARLLVVAGDTVNMAQVVGITTMNPSFLERTNGYLDLGFTATKANESRTFSAGAQAQYIGRTWDHQFTYSGYYQSQVNTEDIVRTSVNLRTGRRFTAVWSVQGTGLAEQNDELNLDLRTQLGLGVGHRTHKSSHLEIHTSGFLQAGKEINATDNSNGVGTEGTYSAEVLLRVTLDAFKYASPKLDSRTTFSLIPSITQSGRVRTELDTRTSYEVYSDLFLALTFKNSVDNQSPSTGGHVSDWTLSFTVGWSWS